MSNPFDKKKDKRLWETWEEHTKYKELTKVYSAVELVEWDKKFLVPQLWGRMMYIEEVAEEFFRICDDPSFARALDAHLRPIVLPDSFDLDLPDPEVGKKYLEAVKTLVQSEFLDPLNKIKGKYSDFVKEPDVNTFIEFLNDCRFMFDIIVRNKTLPFTYHFQAFATVTNIETGEDLAHEPKEVSMILKPFEIRMNELVKICETSNQSIDLWIEKRSEERNNLINFATSQTKVEEAHHQKENSKWVTWFQIATIFFTISVVILGDRAILISDNTSLRQMNEQVSLRINSIQAENESLNKEIKELSNQKELLTIEKNKLNNQIVNCNDKLGESKKKLSSCRSRKPELLKNKK